MKATALWLGAVFALFAGQGMAQAAVGAASVEYGDPASWLCRPDRDDVCRTDLSSTVIDARGQLRTELFERAVDPPIDCFYVYPTVSEATSVSAPLAVTTAEARAARQQFARFASVCRPYAPLYRQVSLESLKRAEDGAPQMEGVPEAIGLAERDVLAAWRHYLAHDNAGRGVVLIGHSQGAGTLISLIAREIDGKPIQDRLVSAIIAGQFIETAKGQDRGGTFKSVPACRSPDQTGCVIAFDTWREESPPAGRPPTEEGAELLCANPAALTGGRGFLKPYLSTIGETIIPFYTGPQGPWTDPSRAIPTPFVQLPDLLLAECVDGPTGRYLAVGVRRQQGDQRPGRFTGDVMVRDRISPDYGLHLIDLNLAMGNVLDVVRRQSTAFQETRMRTRP